jgi:hypothetical protein|nr:hypothetical protein [uncultured Prevotella sp.]UVX63966.1 MAG: hypothetical protein [Bacteriophage sp.]
MANENNKPYFLLVFEKGDTIPTIIPTETISEIYPNTDDKTVDIITLTGNDINFENVESFKMVPAEEINFNM